ncbi:MAG TPA: hypothetical protein DEP56_12725 [Pseudomonas sp.]|nr:hypothetical protein [Pseudomonas sp.]
MLKARMLECAPRFVPFTRASNAVNPKGRVVGCPGGSLRGLGKQPTLARREGERLIVKQAHKAQFLLAPAIKGLQQFTKRLFS